MLMLQSAPDGQAPERGVGFCMLSYVADALWGPDPMAEEAGRRARMNTTVRYLRPLGMLLPLGRSPMRASAHQAAGRSGAKRRKIE